MTTSSIRIGGASGYWGDASLATPQLLASGNLDYIVYDYLAEVTMSIMAKARAKDPQLGYATDFVSAALKPNLKEISKQGVKIISNAGGENPTACGEAIRVLIAEQGLNLKVAIITGDDLIEEKQKLADAAYTEMFSGKSFPALEKIVSANAYLGAFPIAQALAMGADIVVTGRGVDSAVTLGACIHEFSWQAEQWDHLAQASLAGHLIECGTHMTGGNYTDWETVADTLADAGYPIVEINADSRFVCCKPEGTGGAVTIGTVAEQLVYEIGDPQRYILPDVICDFSEVTLNQIAENQVSVSGAKGYPAPDHYKVSLTWEDGFRGGQIYTYYGRDAERRARVFADNALIRARRALTQAGLPDFTETCIEVIGCEGHYGAERSQQSSREVDIKIAAMHPSPKGVALLIKETLGVALAAPPGLSIFQGGMPKPSMVVRLFSLLVPKTEFDIRIEMDGQCESYCAPVASTDPAVISEHVVPCLAAAEADWVAVSLEDLAWARSGDKGNKANIGVIARREEYLPYIAQALTEERVARAFSHFLENPEQADAVERFYLPGINGLNFLLHDVLSGGGVASLRNDPQGKGYSQLLLGMSIKVPPALLSKY
ncbi:DUF1446 domain-containing protein [Spongiibacter sp. KMU-158]|uniref:DUF1446 domain-containing protein n=1 Tax=Spongiibacter pelagi TaxID=2760804 RepID=A0A927GVL5_9GAMM|nr:acyclic terpene utilization AtuA family protein [Spongiibacter pelagi]MBD2858796.1 DUF1446 domain-containing protein [Spongiibacter pelagi]